MFLAKKVAFIVAPLESYKNPNLLPKQTVRLEKADFPVLSVGLTYHLTVEPYTFGDNKSTYDSVEIKVQAITYREADGCYVLVCTAGAYCYPGLCLTFGEAEF